MEGRNKKTWAALILGVAFLVLFTWGFISIVDELRENEVESFDKSVIDFVQGFISPGLTTIMTTITFLGGVTGIAVGTVISILILLLMKKVPLAVFMAVTVGIGGAFNSLLKSLFKRDRPDFHVLIEQGDTAFRAAIQWVHSSFMERLHSCFTGHSTVIYTNGSPLLQQSDSSW
ncbi:phosphatase PAP2 family protein [Rossellomorea sp. H39__3]